MIQAILWISLLVLKIADLHRLIFGLFDLLFFEARRNDVPLILKLLLASSFEAGFIVAIHLHHHVVSQSLTNHAARCISAVSLGLQHQTGIDLAPFFGGLNAKVRISFFLFCALLRNGVQIGLFAQDDRLLVIRYLRDIDALDDHKIADEDNSQNNHKHRANGKPKDVLRRQRSPSAHSKDSHYNDSNNQPSDQQQQCRKQHLPPDNLLHKILIFRQLINHPKFHFHSLLAHLAEHIEVLRLTVVRLIVNMLELNPHPSLDALPVDVPRWSCAVARCHVLVLIVFLADVAKPALQFERLALLVESLVVDEPPVGHLLILTRVIIIKSGLNYHLLLGDELLTDLAPEEEQQQREEDQEDYQDLLLGEVGGGVGFGVALLEAVRADAQGYDGEDEAQEQQSEEEVLALDLALDGLVLRAPAGEIVAGLVVFGALLAGEEVLGVALNFQRTGDSGLEVGLEAI